MLGWSLAAQALSVTDAVGDKLDLPAPASRIISLAPHATEMLFAAGAGDQVVGTVDYSNYPPAARRLPHVGGYAKLDLEAILALKPDLVVAWASGNPGEALRRLRELGLKVYVSEPRRLEDIPRDLRKLGILSGHPRTAATAAEAVESRIDELRRRYSGQTPVRVFYQIWSDPLITINGEQFISQVIRLCGGVNVFADASGLAPKVGVEAVLQRRPDAIIASGMASSKPQWLAAWRRWSELPAVRYNALFSIDPDLIQRQGPRIIEGAAQMCRDLQQTRQRMTQETDSRE